MFGPESSKFGLKSSEFHPKINIYQFQPNSLMVYLRIWEAWKWGCLSNYLGIVVAMATKTQVYLGENHQNFTQKSTSADCNHFHKLWTWDMRSIELVMFCNINCYSGAMATRTQVCLVQSKEIFTRNQHPQILSMLACYAAGDIGRMKWGSANTCFVSWDKLAQEYFAWPGVFWTETHSSFGCYNNQKMFKITKLATIPCST